MANQVDKAVQSLREAILAGRYNTGEKLGELHLCDDLMVSRTSVRLALAELEKEGLVSRKPNSGYRVRSFTINEVADAILVRAELEGMAARLCAERSLDSESLGELERLVAEMNAALREGFGSMSLRTCWVELNGSFHDAIVDTCGNPSLRGAIADISKIPLTSPRALVFDQSDARKSEIEIAVAHKDHIAVLDAIRCREGQRAASIMREHAYRSAQNKQNSFEAMKNASQLPALPGFRLVKG